MQRIVLYSRAEVPKNRKRLRYWYHVGMITIALLSGQREGKDDRGATNHPSISSMAMHEGGGPPGCLLLQRCLGDPHSVMISSSSEQASETEGKKAGAIAKALFCCSNRVRLKGERKVKGGEPKRHPNLNSISFILYLVTLVSTSFLY